MSAAVTVLEPESRELEARALTWEERASELAVKSDADYASAGALLVDIKTLRAEISETFDPVVAAAFKAHRTACDQKKKVEAPLVAAETAIKSKMGVYHEAQERLRREEQLRLEAEARRAEEEARLREAEALEAMGEHAEAERVIAEPSFAPPVARAAAPKAAGVSAKETWSADVTDKMALVRAVAAGTVPLAVLDVNMTVLNQQARALKGELRYPGVAVRRGTTMAARGRAS